MRVDTLIKKLQKMNPDAIVRLHHKDMVRKYTGDDNADRMERAYILGAQPSNKV